MPPMRRALLAALESGELIRAQYAVDAGVWAEAVLTDRALLIVEGVFRPRVTRVSFPLDVVGQGAGPMKIIHLRTAGGVRALWGSMSDPDAAMALAMAEAAGSMQRPDLGWADRRSGPAGQNPEHAPEESRSCRLQSSIPSQRDGKKPKKPRRRKATRVRAGRRPKSTVWDVSHRCVKCGRALTNPNSQTSRRDGLHQEIWVSGT